MLFVKENSTLMSDVHGSVNVVACNHANSDTCSLACCNCIGHLWPDWILRKERREWRVREELQQCEVTCLDPRNCQDGEVVIGLVRVLEKVSRARGVNLWVVGISEADAPEGQEGGRVR